MSIGDHIPKVGDQLIFLGVLSTDIYLGDWRRGEKNTNQLVVIKRVVQDGTNFPFEIVLATPSDFFGDPSVAVDSSELAFLNPKPLEHWE